MDTGSRFDPELRGKLLAEHRAAQRRAWAHSLTPAQRLQRSLGIMAVAHATRALRPPCARRWDEPRELLLAMKARLREADGRA